jgi:threonine/homoserine/homoserine lactone efflux protein
LEFPHLWLFLAAVIVLVVTPGPAVLFIIARSIDQGRTAGLLSVLGIAVGGFVHVIAAAVGISAFLMASSLAFNIVKYLGAIYLLYLGCKKLFFSPAASPSAIPKFEAKKLKKVFFEAVIVAIFNPKTALFFLAFLPQFISPAAGSTAVQFLTLGCLFIVIAFISDGTYAILASSLRTWVIGSPLKSKIQEWFTGGAYIAMGMVAAFIHGGQK